MFQMCIAAAGTAITSRLSVKCMNLSNRIAIVGGEVGTQKRDQDTDTTMVNNIILWLEFSVPGAIATTNAICTAVSLKHVCEVKKKIEFDLVRMISRTHKVEIHCMY